MLLLLVSGSVLLYAKSVGQGIGVRFTCGRHIKTLVADLRAGDVPSANLAERSHGKSVGRKHMISTRWRFQICFMFTPTWGNDPISLYNMFQCFFLGGDGNQQTKSWMIWEVVLSNVFVFCLAMMGFHCEFLIGSLICVLWFQHCCCQGSFKHVIIIWKYSFWTICLPLGWHDLPTRFFQVARLCPFLSQ